MLPPKVILTTTDFSDASRPGVRAASHFARAAGAELHVLFVEETMLAEAARRSGFDVAGQADAELKAFVSQATGSMSPPPTLHVRSGDAVDTILDTAASVSADMVVMASHGRTGVGRAVFGSITEGVLRRTTIPVLVVPDEYVQG